MGVTWTEDRRKSFHFGIGNILAEVLQLALKKAVLVQHIKQDHGYRKTSGH